MLPRLLPDDDDDDDGGNHDNVTLQAAMKRVNC